MEIVIKITAPKGTSVEVSGAGAVDTIAAPSGKRGRPTKEQAAAKMAAEKVKKKKPVEDDEEEETEETEDEEENEEDEETEETEDEEETEEEDEFVEGENLAKLKKALTAHSKSVKSKDKTVKILKKFAPSSEKVKVADFKKLMAALKVV